MSENVKISVISGAVSVLVAICSTVGIIYSKKSDLDEASSAAKSAASEARTLRSEMTEPVLPSGAVVAFRRVDCPANWVPYEPARGRVVVGSGQGEDLSLRMVEETGGEEVVALSADNLPPHNHGYEDWHYYDQAKMSSNYATKEGDDTGNIIKKDRVTQSVGKGEAHNNMPPFVSLLYCRKL